VYDTAILIGRFQPVHNGHLALLHEALACARQVVVIVGSAFQARTPRNPFTWQERADLLRKCVAPEDAARLTICPARDQYDQARWAKAVQAIVARQVQPGSRIALVGHFKDASSSYLSDFPEWALIGLPRRGAMDSTLLREAWFGAASEKDVAAALTPYANQAPEAALELMAQLTSTTTYAYLRTEWQVLRDYRAAWAGAPYPPVFVTVDALVRCGAHVLLVQRGRAPGKGLWALPGGFLEPHDTLWQSCLRELAEETHCALPEASLRRCLREVAVFDHPDRSQRGRTITHVHYFDLGNAPRPDVHGGDDAAMAQWIAINELAAMEDRLFEDHFHVLDHFLAIADTHG
jgi:bifunctional NMN adenylyltransferase/nudix hydrolase